MDNKMLGQVVAEVIRQCLPQDPGKAPAEGFEIPVGASGRHVHLCEADVEALFGKGHQLVKKRDLSQPGQFLCEERITVVGPKHVFQNVAILGPIRPKTQVEVSLSDARMLGIDAPVALSGELEGAADVMLASKNSCIQAKGSMIVARNHVHMTEEAARQAGVADGELVDVVLKTARPITFRDVPVRAGAAHALEMHIDFDEANACRYQEGDRAVLMKRRGSICSRTLEAGAEKGKMDEAYAVCPPGRRGEGSAALPAAAEPAEGWIDARFLTEQHIRKAYSSGARQVVVGAKTIVSPLARDYAREKQVAICRQAEGAAEPGAGLAREKGYFDYITGEAYDSKPEYMTHMYGNRLVRKDAPMIRYRGKLDRLQAEILLVQSFIAKEQGDIRLLEELEEILGTARELMRCELTGQPVQVGTILGLDSEELREHSHHSAKYYQVGPLEKPHFSKGVGYAYLNLIRTSVRETEILAVEAFREGDRENREDILEVLNRLSSAMHIMMCKYAAGIYGMNEKPGR